mgnify:CR=1 FL=1
MREQREQRKGVQDGKELPDAVDEPDVSAADAAGKVRGCDRARERHGDRPGCDQEIERHRETEMGHGSIQGVQQHLA